MWVKNSIRVGTFPSTSSLTRKYSLWILSHGQPLFLHLAKQPDQTHIEIHDTVTRIFRITAAAGLISGIAALRTSPGSGYYAASKCALEGLSDGLRVEAAPLGIKVMVVEPGALRTNFAGHSLTHSSLVIPDYGETADTRRIGKDLSHGTQPGNPDKGALCIIKAIEGDNPPFRLLLGTDAVRLAETVMANRQKEYADWREFSRKSDFEIK